MAPGRTTHPVSPSPLIPADFARDTVAREGEAGRVWIEELPDRIHALLREWDLSLDGPTLHGYLGVVLPVRRGTTALALKVSWIDRWSADEGLALEVWAGQGAVLLVDSDPTRGALLLEWLDPLRTLEGVEPLEAARIAATLLRRLAVPAPDGLRTLVQEVDGLPGTVEEALAREHPPVSRALAERVLELSRGMALPPDPVLVNEDLHYGNVLSGAREPWLVIDPKPLAGVAEYGAAPLLWTRFEELADRAAFESRLGVVVDAGELDPIETRGWVTIRAFECWIWAADLGLDRDAARCRRLLEWLQPGWFSG